MGMIEFWLFITILGATPQEGAPLMGPVYDQAACQRAASDIELGFGRTGVTARCWPVVKIGLPSDVDYGAVQRGLVPKQWVDAGHTAMEYRKILLELADSLNAEADRSQGKK